MKRLLHTLFFIIPLFLHSIAQWENIDGPYGGTVGGIVNDSSGTYFAVSGHYVLTCNDLTEGWATIRSSAIKHNLIHMTPGGVIIVATDSGAIRSFDSGITWEDASNGLQGKITSIVQLSGGRIVCFSQTSDYEGFVCISDDVADNWISYSQGVGNWSELVKDPLTDNIYFIGSNYPKMLYQSTDGIIWNDSALPNYYILQDFMVDQQGRLYILYIDSPVLEPFWYIERSSDQGVSFSTLLFLGITYAESISQFDNGDLAVTVNANYFKRSTDDGVTWQTAATGNNSVINNFIESPGDTLFCRTYSGLYYSPDNGYSWLWAAKGIIPTYTGPIAISDSGVMIAGTSSRLWRSTDEGLSWQDITLEVPNYKGGGTLFFEANHFWIYYLGNQYQFARYDGNGAWVVLEDNPNPESFSGNAQGDTYIANGNLYKSEDLGETWSIVTGSFQAGLTFKGVKCLNSGTVLAIGSTDSHHCYLYRSTDSGNSWSLVHEPSLGLFIQGQIGFHCDGNGNIYTGLAGGTEPSEYYRSNDDGLTWNEVMLPDSLHAGALFTDSGDGLYIKSNNMLYKSINNGNSWDMFMDGLPAYGNYFHLYESESANIYLTMVGCGIYKRGVTVSASSLDVTETPFTIYPNPGKTTVTISYPSFDSQKITAFHLIDISGKCIMDFNLTGSETNIDVSGVHSGTYLLKNVTGIRKLVLIK